jgi:DNA phosphorothioation-dependent restriction protein DptH
MPDKKEEVGHHWKISPEDNTKRLSALRLNQSTIPERIFLGTTVSGNRQVYWEFGHSDLSNRHMLIFGSSGMGKTYTIQCLLCELGRYGQNSLIIDYTNGFSDQHLEAGFNQMLNPAQHIVRNEPLPVNPFRRLEDIIGKKRVPENIVNTAQRVTSVFAEVYYLGEQQRAALYSAIKNGLETCSNDNMTLDDLVQELKSIEHNGGTEGKSAGTVTSKIVPFVDMNPFGKEEEGSWDRLFEDSEQRCHVLQLVGFMREAWRLIVEFSLIDLYAYYRAVGSKNQPRVVVLDEVQNLDQREDSPLAQLLREGRKFGFSLILATQIMSNPQKDERDRLFNAGHKLFFRPADTEMRSYADIAAITTGEDINEWVKRLSRLQKGECYSLGPSRNDATGKLEMKAFKIKVTSMSDRGFNG